MKSGRSYQQTVRAQVAAENEERILAAAEELFSRETFDRLSLAALAEHAGVSIPTLQRKFGNKEGLFAAVGERIRTRVMSEREPSGDDVDAALDALLSHYERDGRLVWHMLKQEADVPMLQGAMQSARAIHRLWVEQVFFACLPAGEDAARTAHVDALFAATDLYLWKLLRIDLQRSAQDTARTLKSMARAVAIAPAAPAAPEGVAA